MKAKWTEAKEKTLKKLLKEYREQSIPDSSHDIQFVANLIEGKEGEEIVKNALLKGEVKRDFGVAKSGNVFVEYQSRGKSSGISTTEADYYVFLFGDDWYEDEIGIIVKTSRLKRIFNSIKYTVNGGDGKSSKGKLIPIKRFLRKEV